MSERILQVFGGLEIIFGGYMTAYPQWESQWIGFVVMGIGVLTVAFALWPGLFNWLWGGWHREYTPLDFAILDKRDHFKLYEAACLWCEMAPTLPFPTAGKKAYNRLEKAIYDQKLRLEYGTIDEILNQTGEILVPEWRDDDEPSINVNSRVYRDELKRYAKEETTERPRFLFVGERAK